jgi:hypothetical protein
VEKRGYDFRGKQRNIFRLWGFHKSAFIHMLFYRILIPLSIIYGVTLIFSVFYAPLNLFTKWFTAVVWILFTPQVYETAKAFALINTRGLAFGRLNESYVYLLKKRYNKSAGFYATLPYIVLALWIVGFVFEVIWWPA